MLCKKSTWVHTSNNVLCENLMRQSKRYASTGSKQESTINENYEINEKKETLRQET